MKPLSTWTPHDIEGVVFDIDDTLTRSGRLEAEAFAALWALRDAGFGLLAVTGRPLGWAEVFAQTWPVDAAVGENGAGVIAMKDGRLFREYAADEATRAVIEASFARIKAQVASELPNLPVTDDQVLRRCDLAFDVAEHYRASGSELRRLQAIIEAEGGVCQVSSVHAHAVLGAWDKASGVQLAARSVLGRPAEEMRTRWVFVGDSGNDAAAFAWFEHSVGVANVRAHLDRLATQPRYITHADRGRGFAELAERLIAHRPAAT